MIDDQQSGISLPRLYCIRQSHLDSGQPPAVAGLERFVMDIAAKHRVEVAQPDLALRLVHPGGDVRLLIASLYQHTIMVARLIPICNRWLENRLVIVQMGPEGWIPIEVRYSSEVWEEYTRLQMVRQSQSNFSVLTDLVEFIARRLAAEKWLEQGQPDNQDYEAELSTALHSSLAKRAADPDAKIWS